MLLSIQACGVPSTPPGEQGFEKLVAPGVEPHPGPKPPVLKSSSKITCPVDDPKAESVELCPQTICIGFAFTLISHCDREKLIIAQTNALGSSILLIITSCIQH